MPSARTDASESVLTCPEAIVELALAPLRARAAALDAEQAVRGLDALSELEFHPLLAAGFSAGGLGVAREAVYPGQVEAAARRRAKRTERERCDLVLLPRAGTKLVDPVAALIEREALGQTLFAAVAEEEAGHTAGGVTPEEAYWLEVKLVGQFCFSDGWSGANAAYASELTRALVDLEKIAADPHIRRGGLLLLLFTADRRIADHDVEALIAKGHEHGRPMLAPAMDRFAITDRIGNGLCTAVLVPARCGV